MAALYGRLSGDRGEVTRTGSKASGIHAQVQTYDSAISVRMEHDDNAVVTAKHPISGRRVVLWEGNVKELLAGGGQ